MFKNSPHIMVRVVGLCLACGATSAQTQTANSLSSTAQTLQQQAASEFGSDSQVFKDLMSAFAPIVAGGPDQQGFSAGELSNLNSSTITNEGIAARNAKQTTGEELAAVGGGNTPLPSGLSAGIDSGLNEQFAQSTAAGLSKNLEADYAQGRQNWITAASGLESAPGVFSSANQAGGVAVEGGKAASDAQNQVSQMNQSWAQIAAGALGAVAGDATSAYGSYEAAN